MRNLKIWWLKRKARKAYVCFANARDRLGCGNEIATHVISDIRRSCDTFNSCMDQLALLGDPTAGRHL